MGTQWENKLFDLAQWLRGMLTTSRQRSRCLLAAAKKYKGELRVMRARAEQAEARLALKISEEHQ